MAAPGSLAETRESPRLWQPVREMRARLTIETEVAAPALRLRPDLMIKGERINDLSPLPPERNFRRAMLDGCKEFVRQMARLRERYTPLTAEADFRLYGPGVTRGFGRPELENMKVRAVGEDEVQWPEVMDFFIVGDFLAEYGHLVPDSTEDERKQIRISSVAEWRRAENAAKQHALARRR